MVTRRQEAAIRILLERETPLSGGRIAEKLGVSTRTLRTDVGDINRQFRPYQVQICATARSGYWIPEEDKAVFAAHITEVEKAVIIPSAPEEREIYIFIRLLSVRGHLTMEALAEEMFVSKTTVSKDIHRMQELVRCVEGVELEISQKKGLAVLGEEPEVFKLISAILLYYQDQYVDYLERALAGFYGDANVLEELRMLLIDALLEQQVILTARSLYIFTMEIFWLAQRKKMGFALSRERGTKYAEVRLPVADIEALLEVSFTEVDRVTLLQALVYKRFLSSGPSIEEGRRLNQQVLERYYRLVRQNYGIELSQDEGLREHLIAMLYYANSSFGKKSLLVDEMKRNYPYAYEIAQQIVPIVQDVLHFELKENEIGRLAARLEVILDRTAPKSSAVVVVDSLSYTVLLKFKIQTYFSHKIRLVAVVPTYQLARMQAKNGDAIDLVLTTIPLRENRWKKVIQISPILSQEDISRINDYLYRKKRDSGEETEKKPDQMP